jgi:ATP-dependent Clp protease ATP-binding subunit ClpB
LNRLDETILFKPLTKSDIRCIINLLLSDLNKRLSDKELVLEMSEEAKDFITDHGYDPVYGARPLKRYVQKHVETLAARIILQGEVSSGDTIVITVEGDSLAATIR